MFYQTGESVIIRQGDDECILLQVTNFLSIIKDNAHNKFVRGRVYTVVNKTEAIAPYIAKKTVELTTATITAEVGIIVHKVMLYPVDDDSTKHVVIDYQWTFTEMQRTLDDVLVPVYPTVGDMVQVCGENDEIWYGHVLEVNEDTRVCQVHLYTEDPMCADRYIRETRGRGARECIIWDSLIHCVDGTWEGGQWKKN